MLTKYKQTGKILSVHQLKEVKGGTGQQAIMFGQACSEDLDCNGLCAPGKLRGTYCAGAVCKTRTC
jgi:hypothetical protein